MEPYRTLAEFYPFYLGEHSNRTCRRLHFVGSTVAGHAGRQDPVLDECADLRRDGRCVSDYGF